MKDRSFFILLFAAITLPTFAQQQPAPAPVQQQHVQYADTVCNDPLEPGASDFWKGDEPNLVNAISHTGYRKKDVQEEIEPLKKCLDLLGAAATNQQQAIKDANGKVDQIMELASSKTKIADQHAADAASRAQAAQLAATQTDNRISNAEKMVASVGQYQPGSETEIRFRPGQTALSKNAKDALDQMAAPLKSQDKYVIEVQGYYPSRNQNTATVESRKMADSVARYLIAAHQIPVHRVYVMAMGNAATSGDTAAKHSDGAIVKVSLLKNELASAEQH
jgi:outer membrane protein OmpA-like peptidoglycan-associated protein